MKTANLVFALVLATCGLLAQTATGGIRGVVTLPDGPVARATVQATHGSSGRTFAATTDTSGRFALTGLPEGTYDVSVPEIGLTTTRVVRRDVMVHAGAENPAPAALLPWAQEVQRQRFATALRDSPLALCLPGDPTPTIPLFYKIVQTRGPAAGCFGHGPT